MLCVMIAAFLFPSLRSSLRQKKLACLAAQMPRISWVTLGAEERERERTTEQNDRGVSCVIWQKLLLSLPPFLILSFWQKVAASASTARCFLPFLVGPKSINLAESGFQVRTRYVQYLDTYTRMYWGATAITVRSTAKRYCQIVIASSSWH